MLCWGPPAGHAVLGALSRCAVQQPPDLYSLMPGATQSPRGDNKKYLQTLPNVPWGGSHHTPAHASTHTHTHMHAHILMHTRGGEHGPVGPACQTGCSRGWGTRSSSSQCAPQCPGSRFYPQTRPQHDCILQTRSQGLGISRITRPQGWTPGAFCSPGAAAPGRPGTEHSRCSAVRAARPRKSCLFNAGAKDSGVLSGANFQ